MLKSAAKFSLIFTGRESLVSNSAIFNQLHLSEQHERINSRSGVWGQVMEVGIIVK